LHFDFDFDFDFDLDVDLGWILNLHFGLDERDWFEVKSSEVNE